jgi:hypothetical protein
LEPVSDGSRNGLLNLVKGKVKKRRNASEIVSAAGRPISTARREGRLERSERTRPGVWVPEALVWEGAGRVGRRNSWESVRSLFL